MLFNIPYEWQNGIEKILNSGMIVNMTRLLTLKKYKKKIESVLCKLEVCVHKEFWSKSTKATLINTYPEIEILSADVTGEII